MTPEYLFHRAGKSQDTDQPPGEPGSGISQGGSRGPCQCNQDNRCGAQGVVGSGMNESRRCAIGDRILPGDTCEQCGARLDILDDAGDEQNTLYIGCPDGSEADGHTHHNGQPAATLESMGMASLLHTECPGLQRMCTLELRQGLPEQPDR